MLKKQLQPDPSDFAHQIRAINRAEDAAIALGFQPSIHEIKSYSPYILGGSMRRQVCECDDGRYRVFLNDRHKKGASLNEYLCYSVANKCGISVPQYGLLKDPKKSELGFGCKYIGSSSAPLNWGNEGNRSLGIQYSSLFVLDHLLGNKDRTEKNIRIISNGPGNELSLEAIDFSEAGFFSEYWQSDDQLPEASDTSNFYQIEFTRALQSFGSETAIQTLNNFLNIPDGFISTLIDGLPHSLKNNQAAQAWEIWWAVRRKELVSTLYFRIAEMANKQ